MKRKTSYKYIILFTFFLLFAQVSAAENFSVDFLNLVQTNSNFFEPLNKIKMKEVWEEMNLVTPLRSVKIGIIDSGLDALGERHPEFRGVNLGNTPTDAKTDTALPDIPGATAGHGTQIAGIIGANNISANGVDAYEHPQMNGILSGVKNLNYTLEMRTPSSLFPTTEFTPAVWNVFFKTEELVEEGVDIINFSSGTIYTPGYHDVWYRPLFSKLNNILFVVSAGNNDLPAELQTPANYGDNFDNVITVGSTVFDDTRLSYSNYGSAVNISAPGLSLYAPAPRGKGDFPELGTGTANYDTNFSGTSASTPLVTGVAGLLKAIKPELTPSEIKQILIRTADPIETDQPIGPRLNAYHAVCDSQVGLNCETNENTIAFFEGWESMSIGHPLCEDASPYISGNGVCAFTADSGKWIVTDNAPIGSPISSIENLPGKILQFGHFPGNSNGYLYHTIYSGGNFSIPVTPTTNLSFTDFSITSTTTAFTKSEVVVVFNTHNWEPLCLENGNLIPFSFITYEMSGSSGFPSTGGTSACRSKIVLTPSSSFSRNLYEDLISSLSLNPEDWEVGEVMMNNVSYGSYSAGVASTWDNITITR